MCYMGAKRNDLACEGSLQTFSHSQDPLLPFPAVVHFLQTGHSQRPCRDPAEIAGQHPFRSSCGITGFLRSGRSSGSWPRGWIAPLLNTPKSNGVSRNPSFIFRTSALMSVQSCDLPRQRCSLRPIQKAESSLPVAIAASTPRSNC